MTDGSAESRLPERPPQTDRQRNKAENGGKIYAAQHGDQTLQENSQAQHLHLYRADADDVIAKLRSELDQALMRIGRSDHHSEMLAERLAAAEARVAELEQQLQLSRNREPAARRRLISSLRTSFNKIKLGARNEECTYYHRCVHYHFTVTPSNYIEIAYQCENVNLFLRKVYDLANKDPLDLMHLLVIFEPFPTHAIKSVIKTGYCIQEIDCYVAELHRAVRQYLDALDGQ